MFLLHLLSVPLFDSILCCFQQRRGFWAALVLLLALSGRGLAAPAPPTAPQLYAGTVGEYAVWLRLRALPGDTAWAGSYYYLRRGGELQLRGRRTATGAWLLRESETAAAGAKAPATGSFTLQPAADGTLQGSWRDAKGRRSLPVTLRPYQAVAEAPFEAARISYRTELGEYKVPVVTVPDAAVTRQLRDWFTLEYVTGGMTRAELQQVRAEHQRGESGGYGGPDNYTVTYNGFGLLSLNWYDEMVGANVTGRVQYATLDLRTGRGLSLPDEIRPELMSRFVAACDSSLQRQIREYLKTNVRDFSNGLMDEDLAGLRQQHVTLDKAAAADLMLLADAVALTYQVEYEGMSHFMFKNWNGAFTPTLTLAELQPYLEPGSPLRRLARPVVSGR
ncbi:hypothetical protein EJV47_14225 [Hymenobacter gummosus]|uniref:DUF3298 domain-containing protein n=1 Tax=Hymenobacter gummosus TaxID=1776032 RepID=A0A3S0K504_9BACT|nr:hypothetical protein [Hymenobacter gummosus]RTQ49293.1 hypothetical protein EJV47_14225 [Hymenobacter gummosus]